MSLFLDHSPSNGVRNAMIGLPQATASRSASLAENGRGRQEWAGIEVKAFHQPDVLRSGQSAFRRRVLRTEQSMPPMVSGHVLTAWNST